MVTLNQTTPSQWGDIDWKSLHVNDANSMNVAVAATAATIVILWLGSFLTGPKIVKAPFVGYRKWWEPTLLVRARFIQGARPIIMDGYKEVSNVEGNQSSSTDKYT